jgi:hypothetical protein
MRIEDAEKRCILEDERVGFASRDLAKIAVRFQGDRVHEARVLKQ